MSNKTNESSTKSGGRLSWLDDATDTPVVHEQAQRLGTFLEAMADGKIEAGELKEQEARVVALMKAVEPKLDDALHEQVTRLLCELTAYNIMQTIHDLMESRPRTRFRG